MRRGFAAVLLAALAWSQPASAQGWSDNGLLSVSYGAQFDTDRLSESVELTKHVESTPLTATLENAAVPLFDVGGTFRLIGSLGVNVALSYLSGRGTAAVEAEVPHPFLFDRRRPISGEAANVLHRELALHTNAAYVVEPSLDLVLTIAGGASFFNVKQDFVTDVQFDEAYPYDSATFRSATLTRASASDVGFNVGADLTWRIGDRWGLGGLIRFSRATLPFAAEGIDFGEVEVGGLQAAGGLRFIF